MLFGRKNPPVGAPKTESTDAAMPAVPEAGAAEPSATVSPLSSLNAAPAAVPSAPIASAAPPSPSAPQATAPQATTPQSPAPTYRPPFSDKGPEMNTSTPKPPTGASIPGASFKPTDIPRRTVDLPGAAPRKPEGFGAPVVAPAAPAPSASLASDQRRLIVGRDISLNGEIGSCDILVVEGTVEAKLRDGRSIEIAETGLFKGSVEIDEADIGGRFEGDITVRGRLTVRSTGKINGSIKYGELAVEAGGQLTGDIQVVTAAPKAAPVAAPVAPALAIVDGE